jgi:hypothetical protein
VDRRGHGFADQVARPLSGESSGELQFRRAVGRYLRLHALLLLDSLIGGIVIETQSRRGLTRIKSRRLAAFRLPLSAH